MDSKLLVYVVLATLGHSAFARRSTPCCVLSEKETGVLSKLRADHDAAILAKADVKKGMFDYLKRLVVGHLFNHESTSADDGEAATIIAEIKRIDKMSVDHMLNALLTALGERRCDDVETTRTAIYDLLDKIYLAIPNKIKLALSGRYSENNDSSFLAMIEGLAGHFFNLLCTCYNITDADTLAVMKTTEHRSLTGLHYATTPLLYVLKSVTNAVASGNKNQTLLHEVDTASLRSIPGVRIEINHEGAMLEALYFNSVLNRRGTMHGLCFIRYTAIVTSTIYKKSVETIFGELFHRLHGNSSQLLKEHKKVLSRIDLAEAKTAALYVAATDAFIEVCLFLRPRDSGEVKHVQKVLNALTDKIAANFFKMIKVVMDEDKRYSRIIAKIHTLESKLVHLCWEFTEKLFDVISGDKNFSEEKENESEIIEKNTFLAANIHVISIRAGAETVANAIHKNGAASTDIIYTLQHFEKQGQDAVGNYAELVADALCLKLLDNYKS